MFEHEEQFDLGDMKLKPYTWFHTEDFTYTNPEGTTFEPGQASWDGWVKPYTAFSEHFHEPHYFVVYEKDGGYELTGVAYIFANLLVPGEKTKTDLQGRQWDVATPGSFWFKYVKDPSGPTGLKLKAARMCGNEVPILGEMIKRGMVKPEELVK
jgi:hypothetical protein